MHNRFEHRTDGGVATPQRAQLRQQARIQKGRAFVLHEAYVTCAAPQITSISRLDLDDLGEIELPSEIVEARIHRSASRNNSTRPAQVSNGWYTIPSGPHGLAGQTKRRVAFACSQTE